MVDPESPPPEEPQQEKRRNLWLIVALVAAIAAGLLLASTVWQGGWKDEEGAGNQTAEAKRPDLESWCAAQASYDAIRRELFRRAAQVRGSDNQAYTRLADFALLRVSNPVARGIDEQLRSVTCSGSAALDLPPGVAAAGGRRSLSGDIEYSIQPAADGTGNVIRLGNADSIVVPLATIARSGQPAGAPLQAPPAEDGLAEDPLAPAPEDMDDSEDAPEPAVATPSFDCGRARTRGEMLVCGDPGLAALDRQMAGQFNAALSSADARQRSLLNRTRNRFLSFRDRCNDSECVAETYRGRMREIGDIMSGRWRG